MPRFSLSDFYFIAGSLKTIPLNVLRCCVDSAVSEMKCEFEDRKKSIDEWAAREGDVRRKMMNVYGNLRHASEWQVRMISAFDKLINALQDRDRDALKSAMSRRCCDVLEIA